MCTALSLRPAPGTAPTAALVRTSLPSPTKLQRPARALLLLLSALKARPHTVNALNTVSALWYVRADLAQDFTFQSTS